MNEQWLTIVEYARAYNVSDMTVRRRIRNGKLNAILRDGKYLIPLPTRKPVEGFLPDRGEPSASGTNSRHDQIVHPGREQGPGSAYPATHGRSHLDGLRYGEAGDDGHDVLIKPTYKSTANEHLGPSNQGSMRRSPESSAPVIIPKSLTVPVSKLPSVSIEAMALIDFCDSMALRMSKSEDSLRREFLAKQAELEAKIAAKDLEIIHLKQQVEDLTLLVSVIDRAKP